MKKLILALAMMLGSAFAQTVSFYTDRAVAPNPFAIQGVNNLLLALPNAQVRVCTYNAPVTFANCTPLANIFDVNGNAISNSIGGNFGQLSTDITGRFAFGCASGSTLIVQVAAAFNNTPSLSYPIVCPNSSLTNIVGPLNLNGNTISNAILNGAGGNNSVALLNQQANVAAITGTGADATLYTFSLPANVVSAGHGLKIVVVKLHTQGTAATTYKLKIGATTWRSDTFTVQAASSQNEILTYYVYNNAGVQNAQNGYNAYWIYNAAAPASGTINMLIAPLTAAIDFTQAQTISFTFNVAATDKEAGQFWSVELLQ
jgi:hypothetical protein